jgi:competence protein ComEA
MVTVFAMMRDKSPAVTSAKLPPVQMASAAPSPSNSAVPAPNQPVVVSVVGLVHKPGLVTLQPGARIADAVAAAGGTLDGADLIGLNIAQHVADGQQILVGIAPLPGQSATLGSGVTPATGGTASTSSSSAPTGTQSGPVDLNTATVEQLDALPGIGPVTAAAIVAWRNANGRFTSIDQLGEVDGIGPARLEKLRNLVRV